VIPWVDDRLHEWAEWARRMEDGGLGYPKESLNWRIMRQGPEGTAIKSSKGFHPAPMPVAIEMVEVAILRMPPDMKEVVKLKYLERGSEKQKAKRAGRSERRFREDIDRAHYWLAGCLEQAA